MEKVDPSATNYSVTMGHPAYGLDQPESSAPFGVDGTDLSGARSERPDQAAMMIRQNALEANRRDEGREESSDLDVEVVDDPPVRPAPASAAVHDEDDEQYNFEIVESPGDF